MPEQPTLSELVALLQAQQARIERLEAAAGARSVDATAPDRSGGPGHPDAGPDVGGPGVGGSDGGRTAARFTRRGMLMGAAAGTAGIVGPPCSSRPWHGAVPLAGSATFTSSTGTAAVTAKNTSTGNGVSAVSRAGTSIHGSTTSTAASAVGVGGTVDATPAAGTGVYNKAGSGIGVSGNAAGGTGVLGRQRCRLLLPDRRAPAGCRGPAAQPDVRPQPPRTGGLTGAGLAGGGRLPWPG